MARGASEAIEHVDLYSGPSTASNSGIFLAASSTARSPFFSGYLGAPRRAADLLLTVAQVVRTRYYTPPGMVQRIIQQCDPVITCGAGVLRFEGFSPCCGVYARLDLLANALTADRIESGTSNVDFNPPMRAALARLRDEDKVRLAVSKTGFEVASPSGEAFERRVTLPARWVKGFVEVQAHQARMKHQFTVSGPVAQRFLRDLPRRRLPATVYISAARNDLHLASTPARGAVHFGGAERLRVITEMARHATELHMYSSGDGATAWRLETSDSRLFVVLSPAPSRGFSGEGQALVSLARSARGMGKLRAALRWHNSLDIDTLAAELSISETEISSALAELGSSGIVGYDLAEAKYFHRELPFTVSRVAKSNPRLGAATELVRTGQVEIESDGAAAWVRGKAGEYRVRRDVDGAWHCLCPWVASGASRGPCKHILAVRMALENSPQ